MIPSWYLLEPRPAREPIGDPSWFRDPMPPQPRHPRLTALLEANAARLRAQAKRKARRLLAESGINNVEVR